MKWKEQLRVKREDACLALQIYLDLFNEGYKLDALDDVLTTLSDSHVIPKIEFYEVYDKQDD